jgi:hypothetical protein
MRVMLKGLLAVAVLTMRSPLRGRQALSRATTPITRHTPIMFGI